MLNMNSDIFNPLNWKRSILVSTLIGFVAVWFLFFDTYSLLTKVQLELKKNDLIERTEEYQMQTIELESKIDDLEKNPDLLEKIAREDYGMRKPNETVYKIKPAE